MENMLFDLLSLVTKKLLSALVICMVVIVIGGIMMKAVRKKHSLKDEDQGLPTYQKEIYDYFSDIQYKNTKLKYIKEKNDVISLYFEDTDNRVDTLELSKSMKDLDYFLKDSKTELNSSNKVALFYMEKYERGEPVFEISNFADMKFHQELEQYADDTYDWWIYCIIFNDWGELEDNFSSVEGICDCRIVNMESIKDAQPNEWDNIKYIDLDYYGDDVDIYEQQLKELFPDAEIHVGK